MEELLNKVNKYKRVLNDSIKDEQKILQVLQKLDWMPISLDILQATDIGKVVNTLRKSEGRVGEQARALVVKWKKLVEQNRADSPSIVHNKHVSSTCAAEETSASNKSSRSRSETHMKHKLDSPPGVLEKKAKVEHCGTYAESKRRPQSSQHLNSDIDDTSSVTSKDRGRHESIKSHHHSRSDHNSSMSNHVSCESDSPSNKSSHTASKSSHRSQLNKTGSRHADHAAGMHNNDDDDAVSVNNIEENGMSFDDFMSFDNTKKKSSSTRVLDATSKVKAADIMSSPNAPKTSVKTGTSERPSSNTSSEKDKKQPSKGSSTSDKDRHKKENKNKELSDGASSAVKIVKKSSSSESASSSASSSKQSREWLDNTKGNVESSKDTKNSLAFVPKPQHMMELKEADILATLPDISPNYHPLPQSLRNKNLADSDKQVDNRFDESVISAKKQSKTKVYAGKTHAVTLRSVPKLFDCCIQVLRENIDYLGYVGGIPASVLLPVLDRCSPIQLFNLEDMNSHFVGDTEELWKVHCLREFKGCQPDELESWRELYLRKHDEREKKLKALTTNIQISYAKKDTGRQTKLAFMDTYVKPPRDVKRQQEKNGTAFVKKHPGASGIRSSVSSSSAAAVGSSQRLGASLSLASASDSRARKVTPKVAPMMAKTMKMMKNWAR